MEGNSLENSSDASARLFLAIDVPMDVKEQILSVVPYFNLGKIKPVEPQNLHITVLFFGKTPRDRIDYIIGCLRAVKHTRFKLSLRSVGAFGPAYRVIFASVDSGRKDLIDLYTKTKEAMDRSKIGFDHKEFSPHVTIARAKEKIPSIAIDKLCEEYDGQGFGSFDVDHMVLKESILIDGDTTYGGDGTHRYKDIATFRLGDE